MAKKQGKNGKRKKQLRGKERQKYHYKIMQQANIQLEEGEEIKQMVDHNDCYFITSHGRLFSTSSNKCKKRKILTGESKNVKSDANKRERLMLRLRDGKDQNYTISRLVAHYFPESVFNPMNEKALDCHHIQPYEVEKGNANNHSENLQMTGRKVHRNVFTPFARAKVTDEGGTTPEFSKKMFKKLQKIETDDPFMIARAINAVTKECTAVWGEMLTEEQIKYLLQQYIAAVNRMTELLEKCKKNPYDCTPEELKELIAFSENMEGEMQA